MSELKRGKKCTHETIFEHLRSIIPATYAKAIISYPWLKCQPHEWNNRTFLENIEYVLIETRGLGSIDIYSLLKKFKVEGKGITTEEKIILNLFVIYLQQQGI